MKYKLPKQLLWLPSVCFGVILRLLLEGFGENEITPERVTLASKCLFWGYSAAAAGRLWENEISPRNRYFGSQVFVLGLFCGCCRKVPSPKILPSTYTNPGWLWTDTKCHACHVQRRWMSPSATPATQRRHRRLTAPQRCKCHACHAKRG